MRFFHLGQQIFGEIGDESFINCRKSGRSWKMNIDAEDFAWVKITKKFPCESGETSLHIAAMSGQMERFMNLLDEAEDKNPYDQTGATPYHYASHYGHLLICQKYCSLLTDINPSIPSGFKKDSRGIYIVLIIIIKI